MTPTPSVAALWQQTVHKLQQRWSQGAQGATLSEPVQLAAQEGAGAPPFPQVSDAQLATLFGSEAHPDLAACVRSALTDMECMWGVSRSGLPAGSWHRDWQKRYAPWLLGACAAAV